MILIVAIKLKNKKKVQKFCFIILSLWNECIIKGEILNLRMSPHTIRYNKGVNMNKREVNLCRLNDKFSPTQILYISPSYEPFYSVYDDTKFYTYRITKHGKRVKSSQEQNNKAIGSIWFPSHINRLCIPYMPFYNNIIYYMYKYRAIYIFKMFLFSSHSHTRFIIHHYTPVAKVATQKSQHHMYKKKHAHDRPFHYTIVPIPQLKNKKKERKKQSPF